MERRFTDGRFSVAVGHALFSPDGAVVQCSRDLRGTGLLVDGIAGNTFGMGAAGPRTEHRRFRDHLEQVRQTGEPQTCELRLGHTDGERSARLISVPEGDHGSVRTFFYLAPHDSAGGREPVPTLTGHAPDGFMVLRVESGVNRLVIACCDDICRRHLGDNSFTPGRSIYQILPVESCQLLARLVHGARATAELRHCEIESRKGTRIRVFAFATERALLIRTRVCASARTGSNDRNDRAEQPADAGEGRLRQFLQDDLHPDLQAARCLVETLQPKKTGNHANDACMRILGDLLERMEAASGAISGVDAHARQLAGGDVVNTIIEGVRAIVHPAVSPHVRRLAVLNEVDTGLQLVPVCPVDSLQQVLIDLIGEAAEVCPSGSVTCRLRSADSGAARTTIEFVISAEHNAVRDPAQPSCDRRVERRPMVKACRRFLRAMDAELEIKDEAAGCGFRFHLPFGTCPELEFA